VEEKTSLFLVPTPIGNLGDITLRALDVLKSVDLILAEDTRTSGVLLKHFSVSKPLQSFHNHNEHRVVERLIERMKNGEVMALISDAGTPGISDPGFLIARAAIQSGLKIECLPGANAFVPALLKSGLGADRFVFEGFLPQKKGRQTLLKELSTESRTMIFYESPHRLVKTLGQFAEYFGASRRASVSRELTKKFEETVNGTLEELVTYYTNKEPRGEIVIVVAGVDARNKREQGSDETKTEDADES
jgi:16S rRNA (cytidine1402-2'-O)-methyltransferase